MLLSYLKGQDQEYEPVTLEMAVEFITLYHCDPLDTTESQLPELMLPVLWSEDKSELKYNLIVKSKANCFLILFLLNGC